MNIIIVIDETPFYHPNFINDLTDRLSDHNILCALVTKIKKTSSIENYLIKNINNLYLKEIFLLLTKKIVFSILGFFNFSFKNNYYSVKSVLKLKKISFFNVKYDINKPEYINKILHHNPDIIISSCSVIFKSKLLKIPNIGIINRHSSLLPSYRGIWPVLHSIADNNKYSGVTIHLMTNKIDQGLILAQQKILNINNNLSQIYEEAFSISSDLIIRAIKNLIDKKYLNNNYVSSYYSFPTNERFKLFRKNKGRFI